MDTKSIISKALNSPSGDNCQPWRFSFDGDKVLVFNDPKADESLYNFNQVASFVSEGALIENIKIAAASHGYNTQIKFFPDYIKPNCIAELTFIEDPFLKDPLYSQIDKRVTNRKSYSKRPINEDIIELLRKSVSDVEDISIENNEENIKKIAAAASNNERLVLGNMGLHKFLFSHIRWSKKEIENDKKGFYVETFEMNGLQKFIFKMASDWHKLRYLNKLGLRNKIASENEKIYASSPCFVAIHKNSTEPLDFIRTGMQLQKLWLTATSLGIYGHPLTGIIFLKNRLEKDDTNNFSADEKDMIDKSYDTLKNAFKIPEGRKLTFMIRLGYADKPSAVSPKMQLSELTE